MKKVSSLKSFLPLIKRQDNELKDEKGSYSGTSILGNIKQSDFGLPRGLANLTGFLGRKGKSKEKNAEDDDDSLDRVGGGRVYLAPPLPPSFIGARLKRVNSSTLSLNRTKKKVLTLEELYVEILYTILHMIGCDSDEISPGALTDHIKEAFQQGDSKHQQLLDIATMKEEPYLKLNLEIHGARNLIGKDISGNSDPFCTFYLSSNPLARNNTSYKPRTLNPSWNEEYILDVNNVDQDLLRVDVWDFNNEENVSDKLRKINEVKDGRGFRKLIKETLDATTGKYTHELLGSVQISLKSIPASGVSGWWNLEKPDTRRQTKERGEVRLTLTLSTEKDSNVSSQEHRHLLKILFAYELRKSKAAPFTWNGSFSRETVVILSQHAVQGKLTGADTALARWLVYCHTHCDLPLDYRVFLPILEKIEFSLDNSLLSGEEENKFAEVALIFVQHCVEFVRKHRQFLASDPDYFIQLESILRCLTLVESCIFKIDGAKDQDLDLRSQVEVAISTSLQDWYNYILDKMPIENNRLMRIKNLTNLSNILGQDLKEGSTPAHNIFQDSLGIDYKRICFDIYEAQLGEVCSEFISEICEQLQPVIYTDLSCKDDYVSNTIAIGTSLFELYLALQSIVKEGSHVIGKEIEEKVLYAYYTWFNKAVPRWLDIALYKAMQRIVKAVELDDLTPVDDLVKHSSSAVDIRTVLMQIKTFWAQLNWPDVEASYAFISKILDDVCKTTIFYSDKMVERVNRGGSNNGAHFKINKALCLAINNIDYVLQYIQPFVNDLGYDTTLSGLKDLNGDMVAASCRRTLTTLVQNAMENVENKILEILEEVGEKMAPVIGNFLTSCSTMVANTGRDCTDKLLKYLDENLILLKENLTERNFDRILDVIWECSAQTLENTIYHWIEIKKPPTYFKTLCDVLKVLLKFFYGDKIPADETLNKMRNLLQLYASDTPDLISRYYKNRLQQQRCLQADEFSLGSVTIRVELLKEHLRIEILNARELKPPEIHRGTFHRFQQTKAKLRAKSNINMSRSQRQLDWVKSKFSSLKWQVQERQVQMHTANTQGQADPYISIRLVPDCRFSDCPKLRTRCVRGTLFPLFDEKFDLVISSCVKRIQDAYLLITVKDRGLMGQGIFLGEALLSLQEIKAGCKNEQSELSKLPQLHLPLTRPQDQESDLVMALDSRIYDRQARDFLKKERRKL